MSAVLDADHYTIRGQKYIRVTRLMAWGGVNDFTKIPARDRDFYMARGTGNHDLWAKVELGVADQYDFDPRVEAYRAAHRRFLDDTGFRALSGGIEKLVHQRWADLGLPTPNSEDDVAGVAGRLDRLGRLQQRLVLLDYKSSSVPKATGLQLALYLLLLPQYLFREVERRGVAFRADGQYRMTTAYPYTDKEDALRLLRRYRQEGGTNDAR